MKHSEFRIGNEFICGGRRWRCTDRGRRIIVAVCLADGVDWLRGPPYAVPEVVFDEEDQKGCAHPPCDSIRLFFEPLQQAEAVTDTATREGGDVECLRGHLAKMGYAVDIVDIKAAYEAYSANQCAGWLALPEDEGTLRKVLKGLIDNYLHVVE